MTREQVQANFDRMRRGQVNRWLLWPTLVLVLLIGLAVMVWASYLTFAASAGTIRSSTSVSLKLLTVAPTPEGRTLDAAVIYERAEARTRRDGNAPAPPALRDRTAAVPSANDRAGRSDALECAAPTKKGAGPLEFNPPPVSAGPERLPAGGGSSSLGGQHDRGRTIRLDKSDAFYGPSNVSAGPPSDAVSVFGNRPSQSRKTITVTAYGYCPESCCCGEWASVPDAARRFADNSAFDRRAKVCAVDRHVFPLGTKLSIPGYGAAIARDRGGAIQGLRIDLFFGEGKDGLTAHQRALAWGVKTLTVEIER